MSMVKLRKVTNNFARVKVKSEVSNAALERALNAFNALECALNGFKPMPIGAPKALMAVPQKHQGGQQEPSRSAKRLLSWPQVKDRVPMSRTTAWRRMREDAFPRPVRISKGRVAWIEDEIVSWINARS
jgi:predicted DNA-binding transcriptional regulator AlpA